MTLAFLLIVVVLNQCHGFLSPIRHHHHQLQQQKLFRLWDTSGTIGKAAIIDDADHDNDDHIVTVTEGNANDDDDDDDHTSVGVGSGGFDDLGLIPSVLSAVRSQNEWIVPTPVQRMVIPATTIVDAGTTTTTKDRADAVWVEAPTGSGKSAAFLLPLLQNLLVTKADESGHGGRVRSLILVPTRELAQQIHSVVNTLIHNLSSMSSTSTRTKPSRRRNKNDDNDQALLSSMVLYGGIPLKEQIERLSDIAEGSSSTRSRQSSSSSSGLDILIATPGRLLDVLTYYDDDEDGRTRAQDATLERILLDALDQNGLSDEDEFYDSSGSRGNKKRNNKTKGGRNRRNSSGNADTSLSLEQLEQLNLDSISLSADDELSSHLQQDQRSPNNSNNNKKTTNGRLQLRSLLNGLEYFIVDEADRVMGNAFRDELDGVLDLMLPPQSQISNDGDDDDDDGDNALNTSSSSSSQLSTFSPPKTWLFSATFPKSIEPRLDMILKRLDVQSPLRLQVDYESEGQQSKMDGELDNDDDENVSASLQKKLERSTTVSSASRYQQVGDKSTIQLRTIRLERPARTQALKQLLADHGVGIDNQKRKVLVFVATRYATEHVSKKLRRAGIRSKELHGKLDQDARLRRLYELSKGKTDVLISTDVAARGIDIRDIDLVVNYDLPRSTAEFVHRIGRTGRAGRTGTAISFVTADTEAHMDLIESRHFGGGKGGTSPERETLTGFEPNEEKWKIESQGSRLSVPGTIHSTKGLAHDRMVGGIKGRRKSKKDKLREQAAAAALKGQ